MMRYHYNYIVLKGNGNRVVILHLTLGERGHSGRGRAARQFPDLVQRLGNFNFFPNKFLFPVYDW